MEKSLVEMISEELGEKPEFNLPCEFARLVPGHSAYCHNEELENRPRKCGIWSLFGSHAIKEYEKCIGYEENPDYEPES